MVRTKRPLYREMACILQAIRNCRKAGNTEWLDKHSERLARLCKNYLPSGSGIDCGTTLDEEACRPDKLVFYFSYHHMNEGGMYDGWTDHALTVKPSFDGIDIRITGPNRNDVKDYLYETFHHALTTEVDVE